MSLITSLFILPLFVLFDLRAHLYVRQSQFHAVFFARKTTTQGWFLIAQRFNTKNQITQEVYEMLLSARTNVWAPIHTIPLIIQKKTNDSEKHWILISNCLLYSKIGPKLHIRVYNIWKNAVSIFACRRLRKFVSQIDSVKIGQTKTAILSNSCSTITKKHQFRKPAWS